MKYYLDIKKSAIHGKGVFARNNIPKDTMFYQVPLNHIFLKPKARCAYIKGKYVYDGAVLNWINHSCDPNTELDVSGDVPVLKSLRNISPKEEITVDYEKTEKHQTKHACNCGSKNCRNSFWSSAVLSTSKYEYPE